MPYSNESIGVRRRGVPGPATKRSWAFLHILTAAALLAVSSGHAKAQEIRRYCNARFGFCVEYPANFGMEPAPTNDDGRSFYDGEGFRMAVSGINNVMEETLQGEMSSQAQSLDRITYRSTGQNWYVLSGYRGNEIVYLKTFVGKGAVNHLHMTYPARMQTAYGSIVTRISRSFSPGRLSDSH